MSQRTQDPQAALEYAQRAVHLTPDDPRVRESVLQSILDRLKQDPFIAFIAENAKTYVVSLRDSRPIVVPKVRSEPEVYPPAQQTDGERALGMVWWLLLGIIPVGIGSLVLSPLVASRALKATGHSKATAQEQRQGVVALLLTLLLALLGAVFTLLLVLHLIG